MDHTMHLAVIVIVLVVSLPSQAELLRVGPGIDVLVRAAARNSNVSRLFPGWAAQLEYRRLPQRPYAEH